MHAGRVISLAAAVFAVSLTAHAAPISDRIIAVVNKELITLSELQNELEPFQKRLKQQYRGAELERMQRQVQYTVLTRMIERKLQIQIAKTKGVEVTEDDILRAIQEMRRQGEKIDEANPEDKKAIREQLLLLRLVDREVRSGVMVSEPDLKRFYETHQTRFSLPEEYRLSQILLAPRSSESHSGAIERAKLLVSMLRKGSDFAELALKHSDGAEATRGGNLGFVRQGELVAPIERVIATLQPGQVSDPIETPEGIHILRVEEKKPSQFRPFAEVKNEIQGLVYQQKTEDVYQLWIADIKNKAFIEVKF